MVKSKLGLFESVNISICGGVGKLGDSFDWIKDQLKGSGYDAHLHNVRNRAANGRFQ